MRVRALRTVAIAGVLGAVAGVLVALAGRWWAQDRLTRFGFFSYAPLPDDATLSSVGPATDWWQLLWPAVLVGSVISVLAAVALTVRRRGPRPLARGWRGLPALAAVGVVLGGAVAGTLYLRAGTDEVVYHGRYVPLQGITMSDGAYDSTLSVTLDQQPSDVVAFLAVCAGVGLAAGLVTGGVLMVSRRASGAA